MIYIYIVAMNIIQNRLDEYISCFMNYIPKEKQLKLMRIKRREIILHSVCGQILLDYCLRTYFDKRYEDVEFGYGKWGKPYIKNMNNFFYNISHSGDWVVCAVGHKELGIDIEKIKDVKENISSKYFSEKEEYYLKNCYDRSDYIFRIWVLKEAYVKYLGKGLLFPLKNISFSVPEESMLDSVMYNINFKEYLIDKRYRMAACTIEKLPKNIEVINLNKIIGELAWEKRWR